MFEVWTFILTQILIYWNTRSGEAHRSAKLAMRRGEEEAGVADTRSIAI